MKIRRVLKKKINNKLRSRAGMSIAEVLFVVMILGLVSSGLAAGVRLALKQFGESMRSSQAHVLCSSLSSVLSNELRYTNTIEVSSDGTTVTAFFCQDYANQDELSQVLTLDDQGNITSGYGQIALGTPANCYKVLAASAYTNGLGAKVTELTYSGGIFQLGLEVAEIDSGTVYAQENLSIRNANKNAAEPE